MISLLNEIRNLSQKKFNERKDDPDLFSKMQTALMGQEPKFLLISPINRSAQDLDLLGFEQGDVFNATRVPNMIIPISEQSPFLFGGPASYYAQFPKHDGIIVTFEQS